ncbi:MAG: MBL fold metallo-hydrolase [Flavobacteriaceae bacterium]|nr:MBL fold metallo-hydrolase [Flavobacteriaceae bacterium]
MSSNSFKVQFLGAASTVTGSKYLVEIQNKKILIDCGLFQGEKSLRLLNWNVPHYDPKEIDFVLLTHGHLDHTGYLPRLVKLGFQGNIYGTYPTLDVAKIILKDTAKIQESESRRANKEGYSKHSPALPFYTAKDVKRTIKMFKGMPQSQWIHMFDGLRIRFQYNGHILGATYIELDMNGKRVVFSGDVGRIDDLLLYPPLRPKKADILFMESTYGGKFHQEEREAIPEMEKIINKTLKRGGSLFVPSFSVERAQLLMYIFWKLRKENKIPKVQMILDSPEGASILRLFHNNREWHKLDEQQCKEMCSEFHIVKSYKETLKLRDNHIPKIVIAGSGMLTGGRILNYLETEAADPKNTLLFVGYQAKGTRGRKLVEGEKKLKVYGKIVPFHMQVEEVSGLSAHADDKELMHWLAKIENNPQQVFLVHGEVESATALKKEIEERFSWPCKVPELYSKEEIIF